MGWHVGMNAGSMPLALLGVATTMFGILIPSTLLTYFAAQWGHRNRELRAVRAFKQGMAPIVVALLLSTAWILGSTGGTNPSNWPLWLLSLASMLVIWRTRLHILWVLGAGAMLGALHLV
jgi:chromate transporter